MTNENIILIGMPGCGKSTVGVLLAKALCMQFVDTDMRIQNAEKKSLQRIINEKGNAYFIQKEFEAVQAVIASPEPKVIATGGSVVLSPDTMRALQEEGTVVYLEAPFGLIKKRLWNLKTRGIVLNEGQTLHDMYKSRIVYYEKYAQHIIHVHRRTPEQIVNIITQQLKIKRFDA